MAGLVPQGQIDGVAIGQADLEMAMIQEQIAQIDRATALRENEDSHANVENADAQNIEPEN